MVASCDAWKDYSAPEKSQAWLVISLGLIFSTFLIGLPLVAYGIFCLVRASGWFKLGSVGTAIQVEGLFAYDEPIGDMGSLLPMWRKEAVA